MTTNTLSKYYRKINSVYQRDKKGVFIPEFADPLYEEYLDESWMWYYKWNGTNVGFEVGGDVFGRTERTALTDEQWGVVRRWQKAIEPNVQPEVKYVYGELVGPGVQGNPHQLDRLTVVTFDTYTDRDRYNCNAVNLSHGMGLFFDIPFDPEASYNALFLGHGSITLRQMIDLFREGDPGRLFDSPAYFEGVIGYLWTNLNGRPYQEIATKIKVEDRWSW